jgi:hypothetical protein
MYHDNSAVTVSTATALLASLANTIYTFSVTVVISFDYVAAASGD